MAWSTYIKVAIAAFVGKLLAVVFVAASVMIGFGPDKWASFLVEGFPAWITPSIVRTTFLLLAALVSVQLVWPLISYAINAVPNAIWRRSGVMITGLLIFVVGIVCVAVGAKIVYNAANSTRAVVSAITPRTANATPTTLHPPLSPSGSGSADNQNYIAVGLMKAREDLLSLKKENLTCAALNQWQARADTFTRLAHAEGIGVHNPISQYLGACQNITDVEILDKIRTGIVRLLDQGIEAARNRSG